MKRILLSLVVLVTTLFTHAQMRYLKGGLSSSQEVPVNPSAAAGVTIVKYNTVTNSLELYGNYQGLTSDIVGSHIHGPAAPGVEAGVLFPIPNTGGTSGALSLSTTITEAQEADLLGGMWYVNVHSANYTGGEIRAQLTTTTEGQTNFMNARLQGSQEVPPNPSMARGSAYVLLDRFTNTLYLTGNYMGLNATISGSHIHNGNPGTNGGVIFPLTNSGGTTGTLHLETPVSDAQKTAILNSGTYVNVHSTGTYAAGEIRGQLTNYSQLNFFGGSLTGAAEVPAVTTSAKGTVIVRYDAETNLLELTGDYQSLTTDIVGSHIHGPAAPGAVAGVLFTINNTGGITGTLTLSTNISEAQEADLLAGLWYVNVHSTTYTGGEIRAQLMATTAGSTQYFTGTLQGAQEAPPVTSPGSGSVTSILDIITGQVYLTGTFSGLSSNAIMAHIHQAPPGTSAGVILTLSVPTATSGTVTGSGIITPAQVNAMVAGNTYVNIHSVNFGSGELRAQLGNLVLPMKLLSLNAFKESGKVVLAWTTAQESNLLSYDIEQQDAETKMWLKKGTVTAKGRTDKNNYSFNDVPSAAKSEVILYRLKINEQDGKASYSNVVRVNYKTGKGELTVLSNPVRNGMLRFAVTGLRTNDKAEASVIDYNGRVIVRTTAMLFGNNEIAIGHLPAGMYRLAVRVNGEVMQQSFVK